LLLEQVLNKAKYLVIEIRKWKYNFEITIEHWFSEIKKS
jgi:hypothetical protein